MSLLALSNKDSKGFPATFKDSIVFFTLGLLSFYVHWPFLSYSLQGCFQVWIRKRRQSPSTVSFAATNKHFACLVLKLLAWIQLCASLQHFPPLSYSHFLILDCPWFFRASLFHLPPLFASFLLLLLQQIPCFFHLFTHCCLKVLRNCYIMHFKLSQCMHYGYGWGGGGGGGVVIRQTLQDLIRSKEMKLTISCFTD